MYRKDRTSIYSDDSLSSSTENAIWDDLQQNEQNSDFIVGSYSPTRLTPPPVRSLSELRNMYSQLSLPGPCADCENNYAIIGKLRGTTIF